MKTVWEVRVGDVLDRLREMPDESVHMVCTSPPYWGLRDYGTAAWDGGDPACGHVERQARGDAGRPATMVPRGAGGAMVPSGSSLPVDTPMQYRSVCGRCGARRVDQQLGLEATPDCGLWALAPALREQTGLASCGVCYVCRMVAVFREVRRVLRSDGTCWVNMGDGYAHNTETHPSHNGTDPKMATSARARIAEHTGVRKQDATGLKPKDLIGMPWSLAKALQADGWWLRSEIIWAKPNPMPESVQDRPTKAHEQIFLLTKAARYFYDADAIREPAEYGRCEWNGGAAAVLGSVGIDGVRTPSYVGGADPSAGRNARSVWTIATQPYSEAHFATFPEELPRRCILAGTSERGVCPACGAPWKRVVEREFVKTQNVHNGRHHGAEHGGWKDVGVNNVTTTGWEPTCAHGGEPPHVDDSSIDRYGTGKAGVHRKVGSQYQKWLDANPKVTTGWDPECSHALDPVPATVLDPFSGAATTGLVAVRHGRSYIGIELNPEYARMGERRILADHGAVEPTNGHTPAEVRGVQGRLAL